MQYFEVLASFISLIFIAAFLTVKARFNSGIAPFLAVVLTTLYFSTVAMVNALLPLSQLFFLVAFAMGVYSLYKIYKEKLYALFLNQGFLLFVFCGLLIIALYCYKKPMLYTWDEFSFWGVAAKLTKLQNQLYTIAPSELVGRSSPPALVAFGYFFGFLGNDFFAFKIYIAYFIMFIACFSAVISCFDIKKFNIYVPLTLLLFLSPFLFNSTISEYGKENAAFTGIFGFIRYLVKPFFLSDTRSIYVNTAYLSSYADIPLGIIFGATLALYFTNPPTKRVVATIACSLAMLTLVKDIGFALALICAAIVCADLFFSKKLKEDKRQNIIAKSSAMASIFAAPFIAFVGFSAHLQSFAGINRFELGGSAGLSTVGMLKAGITELFSSQKSEKFIMVYRRMGEAAEEYTVSVLGTTFNVLVVVALILLLVFSLSKSKELRRETAIFTAFSAVGFALYYIFVGFTYVYIFQYDQAEALVSFDRYIVPYLLAVFITCVVLLAKSCEAQKLYGLNKGILIGLSVALLVLTLRLIPLRLSFVAFPDEYYFEQREQQKRVDNIAQYIDGSKGDIFYINTKDKGDGWFYNYYYFLPLQLDYSAGGGTISTFNPTYSLVISPQQLQDYLLNRPLNIGNRMSFNPYVQPFGYVYIEYAENDFAEQYKELFSDEMFAYYNKITNLYSVEKANGSLQLVPVRTDYN